MITTERSKELIEKELLKFLRKHPRDELFSRSAILGEVFTQGEANLLTRSLKKHGFHPVNSPQGMLWSRRPRGEKWINPRREVLEAVLDLYLRSENPEEVVTQEFLTRFLPNAVSTMSDKHLLARILESKGWVRKNEAMPLLRGTRTAMARVWIKPKPRPKRQAVKPVE